MKKFSLMLVLSCLGFLPLFGQQDYAEPAAGLNIEMVYVEGGTFKMGNNKDKVRQQNEENVHDVTLDDFYIGKYDITVAQFAAFVADKNKGVEDLRYEGYRTDAEKKGSSYVWNDSATYFMPMDGASWRDDGWGNKVNEHDYPSFPVIFISWNDAMDFCKWLSEKTGKDYTLPTEAQWEFVARGGNESKRYKYSGGNKLKKVAWSWESSKKNLHEVGELLPNELGVYDMSGNVWEWCLDWYVENYPTEAQTNPCVTEKTEDTFRRVIRGGAWTHYEPSCRVSARSSGGPDAGSCSSGFRVVCNIKK